jgi:multidrug resistance efflux pump
MRLLLITLLSVLALAACKGQATRALGTLEFDRMAVPAPAAEKIVSIDVKEGQRVQAGQVLLQLEPDYTQAQLAALQAQTRQNSARLDELRNGPRREEIAAARANLAAAQAQAVNARAAYARADRLAPSHAVSTQDVDSSRAATDSAAARTDISHRPRRAAMVCQRLLSVRKDIELSTRAVQRPVPCRHIAIHIKTALALSGDAYGSMTNGTP